MRKFLKWTGIILASLVGLVILVAFGMSVSTNARVNKEYAIKPEPVVTSIDGDFVQRMKQICKDFTDQEAEIIPLVGGTLPLLEAMKKNIGILGVSTSGNPAYYGSGAHAPNEHIRLSDIARAIEFNAFMFEKLEE
jgi:acetylornithine deacetylase/succinyl-diaminopimelate desuccinylase-like protein